MNREVSKLAFTLAEGASYGAVSNNHLKVAFTLAEVLITIGIIGVVAAMTLSAIIQNRKNKELQTALSKNYSVLQSALQKANYDNGELITPLNSDNRRLKPVLLKQMKYAKDCGFESCIKYSAGVDNSGAVTSFMIKNYKTFNNKTLSTDYFDDGQFMLNDGSLYLIENPTVKQIFITIDINGMNQKPNKWGHDLFTFQIMNDGKLLPMGAQGTNFSKDAIYCSPTSSSSVNGIGCTYKALTDKNYFKNLP